MLRAGGHPARFHPRHMHPHPPGRSAQDRYRGGDGLAPVRHNGLVAEPGVQLRSVTDSDRPMLRWLIAELWGSEMQAVHGDLLRPAELPGFLAEQAGRIAGLLTFRTEGGALEIVTLNAIDRRMGIGTLLIEAAVVQARRSGCHRVWLTTTNDNVDALRFYQRRGFRLAELRPGAVDRARVNKPAIPRTGDYGIPLRDEIDLTMQVIALSRLDLTAFRPDAGNAGGVGEH